MISRSVLVLPGSFLRKVVARLRVRLAVCHGVVTLALATRRRSRTELWIGDSHAAFMNAPRASGSLTTGARGQLVWWLGPRLMWSIAQRGFPRSAVAGLGRTARPNALLPIFVFGEIDVRCHLAAPGARPPDAFVPAYLARVRDLTTALNAGTAVIVVPPPPSSHVEHNPLFPVAGSIGQRVEAFHELRRSLRRGLADPTMAGLQLLDASAELCDETGGLDERFTDDGCHTNAAGRRVIADRLDGLLATLPIGAPDVSCPSCRSPRTVVVGPVSPAPGFAGQSFEDYLPARTLRRCRNCYLAYNVPVPTPQRLARSQDRAMSRLRSTAPPRSTSWGRAMSTSAPRRVARPARWDRAASAAAADACVTGARGARRVR